jgi:hypothetical protein
MFHFRLFLLAITSLALSSCATSPQIQIGQKSGAKMGLFWFSGLNGDQASDSVARQLLVGGYNLIDLATLNRAVLDTKFNPQQISTDSLAKLRTETGIDFLLIGSSSALPGLLNFSHAKMSLTLIDVRQGTILWKETCGNSIWTGSIGTKGDVERGASFLVSQFDRDCSQILKGKR